MSTLSKRQSPLDDTSGSAYDNYPDSYGYDPSTCYEEHTCSWWWSSTGSAVRYTIVSILFFLLIAYFAGGYLHARARLRKNLPPLAYHRWMVKRSHHHPHHHMNDPRYYSHAHGHPMYHQNPYYGQQQHHQHPDNIGMQSSTHAPPPPAYNASDAPPPVYQPPMGSSKVAADQNFGGARVGESSGEVRAPDTVAGRGV